MSYHQLINNTKLHTKASFISRCQGGYLVAAWEYWVRHGLVTGGQYGSHSGCKPYSLPKCEHHVDGPYPRCPSTIHRTPNCEKKCEDGYGKTYQEDKHHGKSAQAVVPSWKVIATEIMTNGPVEGAFTVYADFVTYKSGEWWLIIIRDYY